MVLFRMSATILASIVFLAASHLGFPLCEGDGWQGAAAQEKAARLDFNGDPLPDGALARHGTYRRWHKSAITQLVFTPDGQGLLSIDKELAFYRWDLKTGKEMWRFDRKYVPYPLTKRTSIPTARLGTDGRARFFEILGEVNALFLASHSADAKVLAIADPKGGNVIVLNPTTGKQLLKIQLKSDLNALAVSPSGKLLALSESERQDKIVFRLFDLGSGKELTAPRQGRLLYRMGTWAIAADDKQLAGINGREIHVWDLAVNKRTRFYEHEGSVSQVVFSPDGSMLASSSSDGTVRVWDKNSEEEIKKLAPPDTRFTSVAFMPDSKAVVAGDRKGRLHIWDLASGTDKILKAHSSEIAVVCVSPTGSWIASASDNGGISLWDAVTGEAKIIVKETELSTGVGIEDGGHSLLIWTASGQIRQLDTLTGAEFQVAYGPPKEASNVMLTANGQIGAWFNHKDKTITLWDAAAGAVLRKLPTTINDARIVGFSPDNQWVVTAELEGNPQFGQINSRESSRILRLWNVTTGKQFRSFPKIVIGGTSFSPDGKLLVVLTDAEELCLFELATGKERCRLRTLCYNTTTGLAFSPNGRQVVITADNAVCLWDLTKAKPLRGFYGHDGMVLAVAFAPKGDVVASGGVDGTVRLWKTDTGEELRCFTGHHVGVEKLAFSDDGKMLISFGSDQSILVWDATARAAAVKAAKVEGTILERCWADLGHDEPPIAFKAMGDMIDLPQEAVALMAKKLEPVPAAPAGAIDKLIADLDSESFVVREKATKELEEFEGQARQALENAFEKSPSNEVYNRAKMLLERLDAPLTAPVHLRSGRAVEVLERIGTKEAQDLLTRLAKGAPGARLTLDASRAQTRLAK